MFDFFLCNHRNTRWFTIVLREADYIFGSHCCKFHVEPLFWWVEHKYILLLRDIRNDW